jgi:tetratricopeptide (TPR) repeat protein
MWRYILNDLPPTCDESVASFIDNNQRNDSQAYPLTHHLHGPIADGNLVLVASTFNFCGAIVGLTGNLNLDKALLENRNTNNLKSLRSNTATTLGLISIFLSLALTFPLFNADKLARKADINKDALLAVKAAKTYPESVVVYSRLGIALYESGLYDLSLEIARSAVKFNPNSYQTWILILVNPNATIEERRKAKEELIKIDPLNKVIQNYKL